MNKIENYADAIYQNANVGMQSIKDILPKIEDEELTKEVNEEYKGYEEISQRLQQFAQANKIELKENNILEKAKMWMSINMSTLTDNSTRHIAELLLLGTVMGTTTCFKDKYDHKNTNEELDKILDELEDFQEANFNKLKNYIKNMN